MPTTRSLAVLGGAAMLGTPTAIAIAAESEPAQAPDRSALRAEIADHPTVAEAMRLDNRARAHRGLLRELRRHDHARPRGPVATLTAHELRARTRDLRAERRAAARAKARAKRAAEAAAAAGTATSTAGGPTGHLAAIAQCESGGDPAAIGGGGLYRGMYQFDLQTWQSVGGTGDPAAASVAEQTKRAQILYARAGAAPWPVCGS